MSRSIVVVIFLVSSLIANAAHAVSILVMGDSLSAGYGLAQSEAWPTLLANKLNTEGYRYEVVNASISGETTAGGRSRMADALQRSKPAIVILELGANDGLRGLSLKAMRDNLDAMIVASQKAGAKVLLIGMRMPPNLGQSYTSKFQQTFSDLAKARKTAFFPFLLQDIADKHELFQADNLHPVASAEPTIVANIWKILKPMLKK
ncbi:MAG TPA: arylesterase [Rhodocyclaceae bacterium]|nr:arylesterase [Rhodocyclaceae bacterium]